MTPKKLKLEGDQWAISLTSNGKAAEGWKTLMCYWYSWYLNRFE